MWHRDIRKPLIHNSGVCILGVFVADTAYSAKRLPGIGETIFGSGFSVVSGGKGSNQRRGGRPRRRTSGFHFENRRGYVRASRCRNFRTGRDRCQNYPHAGRRSGRMRSHAKFSPRSLIFALAMIVGGILALFPLPLSHGTRSRREPAHPDRVGDRRSSDRTRLRLSGQVEVGQGSIGRPRRMAIALEHC